MSFASSTLDASTVPDHGHVALDTNIPNTIPEKPDPKRTKVTSRSKKIIQDLKAKLKELEAVLEKKDHDLKAALKQTSPALTIVMEQKEQELKLASIAAAKATVEVATATALFKAELKKIEEAINVYVRLPRQSPQEALRGLDCNIEVFKEAWEEASKQLYIPGAKPRVPEINLTDEGVHIRTLIDSFLLEKSLGAHRSVTLERMFNAQVVQLANLNDDYQTLYQLFEEREEDDRVVALKADVKSLEAEVALLKKDKKRLVTVRAEFITTRTELAGAKSEVAFLKLDSSHLVSVRAELANVKSDKRRLERERIQEKKLYEIGLAVRAGFLAKAYRKYYEDEDHYDSAFSMRKIRDGNEAIAFGKVDVDREVVDRYPALGDAYRKIYFLTRREFSERRCVDTHFYLADVVNLHATIKVSWDFEYADDTEPDYKTVRRILFRILDDGQWEESNDSRQRYAITRDYEKVLNSVQQNVLLDEEILSRVLVPHY